jgi:hypothetical protein
MWERHGKYLPALQQNNDNPDKVSTASTNVVFLDHLLTVQFVLQPVQVISTDDMKVLFALHLKDDKETGEAGSFLGILLRYPGFVAADLLSCVAALAKLLLRGRKRLQLASDW